MSSILLVKPNISLLSLSFFANSSGSKLQISHLQLKLYFPCKKRGRFKMDWIIRCPCVFPKCSVILFQFKIFYLQQFLSVNCNIQRIYIGHKQLFTLFDIFACSNLKSKWLSVHFVKAGGQWSQIWDNHLTLSGIQVVAQDSVGNTGVVDPGNCGEHCTAKFLSPELVILSQSKGVALKYCHQENVVCEIYEINGQWSLSKHSIENFNW